jgi:hypothetical protein
MLLFSNTKSIGIFPDKRVMDSWLAETLPPSIRGLGLSITYSVYYVGKFTKWLYLYKSVAELL